MRKPGGELKYRHKGPSQPDGQAGLPPTAYHGADALQQLPDGEVVVGEDIAVPRLSSLRCQQAPFGHIPHVCEVVAIGEVGGQLAGEAHPWLRSRPRSQSCILPSGSCPDCPSS